MKVSLKFVSKVRINNFPALVQIMAWRRPGDKPLSWPVMVSFLIHISVTRPQWVKCYIIHVEHCHEKCVVTISQGYQANAMATDLIQWKFMITFKLSFSACHWWLIWISSFTWWRLIMETFSALLTLCEGNPPVNLQRPVTQSFDVFFDLCLNKQLSKHSKFETPSRPLWRHSNEQIFLRESTWYLIDKPSLSIKLPPDKCK